MGNKLSCCCLKPKASPKLGQHSGRRPREYETPVYGGGSRNSVAEPPATAAMELDNLHSLFCDGRPILRLSDVEKPDGLSKPTAQMSANQPVLKTFGQHSNCVSRRGKSSRVVFTVNPFRPSQGKDNFPKEISNACARKEEEQLFTPYCESPSVLPFVPSEGRYSRIFVSVHSSDQPGVQIPVFPDHLREKYSSCSTIFLDNSTICQPDTRISVQCLVLAIYYHIKKRDGDRSKDIFDERLHPLTQEAVPEENFDDNPDPESIYTFIRPFFNALKLTAEFSITTLIYLERLTVYAEIDICPTNWRRIVLGAILLAAKYLKDRAVWNLHFCRIHQGITLKDINELETQYLFLLRFRLHVSASVYAKYYFDLRSLASDHKLPNEFACLQKERAQALEAISRYCENKNLCRAAIRKSRSCDNFSAAQRASAILS